MMSRTKNRLSAFAERLRGDGIDAILDDTHLKLGTRTPEFMERSVRDSVFVLVICTEKYKKKFDHRTGGVGYEGHIITGEIIRKIGVNRFIPVLRRGDWDMALPTALDGLLESISAPTRPRNTESSSHTSMGTVQCPQLVRNRRGLNHLKDPQR